MTTQLKLHVTLTDETKGYIFSDEFQDLDAYEIRDWDEDTGEEIIAHNLTGLFQALQREYGRCTSKLYQDTKDPRKPRVIGWVFEKRVSYYDAPQKTYLQHAWVGLVEYTPPSYHYRSR